MEGLLSVLRASLMPDSEATLSIHHFYGWSLS